MNKKLFLSIFLFVLASSVFAQNKQLTIEDAIWNVWFDLAPEDLDQVQWRGNSNDYYVFIEDWAVIKQGNIKNEDIITLCSLDDVNETFQTANYIRYFYDIHWLNNDAFYQIFGNHVYVYDVNQKKILENYILPSDAENIFYNADNKFVVYTIANNIELIKNDGTVVKVTDETDPGVVCGSDYTHRQEFGIDKGIFLSPNGNYFAFYRKDQTMVADYPLIDYTTFPATLINIKYPMAGQTSEEVTLGVYNIADNSTTFLKTGLPKDQYLTAITWGSSEKYIYVGVLNRDQNHLKFNKYDAKTGDFVKTLFEETDDKYVEPEHPAIFLPKTQNQFLWYSERDGYNQFYLYDTDGNLIKQITKGAWVITDFYGFSDDEKFIYIQSTAECAIQRHIYKINMANGKMDMLTQVHGTHVADFTADKKYFINKFSNTETPNVIDIIDNKGKVVKELISAVNPLADYKLANMKIGIMKSADGVTDLYYQMVTPPDFDSTIKYPVVVYVYGGPHAQLVTDEWLSGGLWNYYMAQKGYIMFTVDNRGSADRGRDFENVIHRQVGVAEMADQMEGIKFLKSKSYVDADRIGVHGWSYGGFMTTSLICDNPDVFKVAVAGGPVIDWKYYEVMYGERYMDTPQDNPDGYANASLLTKIVNLKGKLLIIHGGIDPTVVPQNSHDLLLKSQAAGVQVDFYEYPNSEHNVRGQQRIHLMQKVTQYFDDYL
ncbi:MAG: DPP IV N-terminal domain-containing protein [Bacteroidales bacterium]|nr:DPP IV N-terminal domain-containing protein [Bacteroidales bacterium]